MFPEILVSVIGLGFSLFLFILSRKFPPSSQPGVPSAAFFPAIIAVIIFALAMVQVIRIAVKWKKTNKGEKPANPARNKKNVIRLVEIVLLMILYSLLWMFNFGHFLVNSIVIFIPIGILFGGAVEREWWKTSIFIVVLVTFIYCLFKFLLKIPI
jgi:uncharacterized membrane protein